MTLQRRALLFFLLYAGVITYLSLFPGDFQLHPRATRLYWVAGDSPRVAIDTILNVFFYIPLGAAGFLAIGRGVPACLASVAIGTSFSLLIEWLQLWTPSRYGNLRDLAANSLGAVLGAGAAYLVQSYLPEFQAKIGVKRIRPLPAVAWLMLVLWMFWHAFPFFPALSFYRLQHAVAPWSWRALGQHVFGFYVLRLTTGPTRWLWVALLL
ncbi:MAG: VanZ family protein, partial [Acidobacteriota bacterium]